jgi:predicted nucleotidyltransferase component of viral defense system
MQGFLILSLNDQKLAIEQTAARKGWAASSVEKDFWVCWILQKLFGMDWLAAHLTFKGGTSLSKVWNLMPFDTLLETISEFETGFNTV